MSSAASQPRLRLVGTEDARPSTPRSANAGGVPLSIHELAVVKENRLAAHAGQFTGREIDARDPRWILAMQTQARLQGSMLTPERRSELLLSGKQLGLRPFESNLVIAVVQDQARRDSPLSHAESTLGIIGVPHDPRTAREATAWPWWLGAVGAACALAGLAIYWLRGV